MNPMMRAAAAAAILTSGFGSIGCMSTGTCGSGGCGGNGSNGAGGHSSVEDHYRNAVDVCYPERYQHAARQAVIAPFAQQVENGHFLNQTLWNYYFDAGSDKLSPAGMEKLDSLTRTRPAPDSKLYLQTARDITVTPDNVVKLAELRNDLDAKRAVAVQKYMANQPAFGAPIAYEIYVHDAPIPGINAEMAARAYRGSFQGYTGGVSGGAGGGVVGTGGGGGNLTSAPPASGGGAAGGSGGGSRP